eukprot:2662304-Amphidinium_carterae.1
MRGTAPGVLGIRLHEAHFSAWILLMTSSSRMDAFRAGYGAGSAPPSHDPDTSSNSTALWRSAITKKYLRTVCERHVWERPIEKRPRPMQISCMFMCACYQCIIFSQHKCKASLPTIRCGLV